MTRYYAIKMAKRSVFYVAGLLFACVVVFRWIMAPWPLEMTAIRWGLYTIPFLVALPAVLLGAWLFIFAERRLPRLMGGLMAVGATAFAVYVLFLYVTGYQYCHWKSEAQLLHELQPIEMASGPLIHYPYHCHRPGESP